MHGLKFPVVAFFHSIKQIGGGVHFSIVFNLFIALELNDLAVFKLELVSGVFEILLLDEYALEGLRVESERVTSFKSLLISLEIDVFKVFKGIFSRHVGGFGDARVDPLLRCSLNVNVLNRGNIVGSDEIVG